MFRWGGRARTVAPTMGAIVAVRGTAGSPGASTIAASLAALLAEQGQDVILADCDVTRGTLAALLEPQSGVTLGGALLTLPADGISLPDGFLRDTSWGARFLPGVIGPSAPVRIHPDRLCALLERLRRVCGVLVLDLGEELPIGAAGTPTTAGLAIGGAGTPADALACTPGACHAAALRLADLVVLVAADTPQGEQNLTGEYPLLHQVLAGAVSMPAVLTVVNHMATPHFTHWRSLLRAQGLTLDGHVPHDWTALRKTWAARPRRPLPLADPHSIAADALSQFSAVVVARLRERGAIVA